jgi:hypothetical protein
MYLSVSDWLQWMAVSQGFPFFSCGIGNVWQGESTSFCTRILCQHNRHTQRAESKWWYRICAPLIHGSTADRITGRSRNREKRNHGRFRTVWAYVRSWHISSPSQHRSISSKVQLGPRRKTFAGYESHLRNCRPIVRSDQIKKNEIAPHPLDVHLPPNSKYYNPALSQRWKKKLINRVTDLYINISRYLHCTAIVWWRHDKNCWIIRVFFKQPASLNVI